MEVSSLTSRPLYLRKERLRYLVARNLGGTNGRFEVLEKIIHFQEFNY
jgi:hypothetical protein